MQSIISTKNFKLHKVIVSNDGKLFFSFLSNEKEFFIHVPKKIKVSFKDNEIICSYLLQDACVFNTFSQNISRLVNQTTFFYKKKLFLKGLGFKVTLENNKIIVFKLGFSHLVNMPVPSFITNIKIKKNLLLLESLDNALLGNFIKQVESLKPCDSYKEKGFCRPNVKKTFKPIKKK
jgi:ribosomal protein L6P/L9E